MMTERERAYGLLRRAAVLRLLLLLLLLSCRRPFCVFRFSFS